MRGLDRRNSIAVDVGSRRIIAVWAVMEGSVLRVRKVLHEAIPAGVDTESPESVGRWVGQTLRGAGFPSRPITMALTRELVGLKRMTLPTTVRDELPEMIRLGLIRESASGSEAIVDFLTVGQDETSTTVLAFAAPQREVEAAHKLAEAAELPLQRLSLRGLGAAALLRRDSAPQDSSTLAIDLTGEGLELSIVSGGVLRYSRGVELPPLEDEAALAQAAVTEIKRTWLSYRVIQDDLAVRDAVLMGSPSLAALVAPAVADLVGGTVSILKSHSRISSGAEPPGDIWPLLGMLLAPALRLETIDFAHPRRSPDVAARRRQRALIAAGLGTVVLLGAWTVGSKSYQRLDEDVADLKDELAKLQPKADRSVRDSFRIEHLQKWNELQVDWLAHAEYLRSISPPPSMMVLQSWAGTLNAPPFKWSEKDGWTAPTDVRIVVEGEAKDRLLADQFRTTVIQDARYTLNTTGADKAGGRRYPYPFGYMLKMDLAPAPSKKADAGKAGS